MVFFVRAFKKSTRIGLTFGICFGALGSRQFGLNRMTGCLSKINGINSKLKCGMGRMHHLWQKPHDKIVSNKWTSAYGESLDHWQLWQILGCMWHFTSSARGVLVVVWELSLIGLVWFPLRDRVTRLRDSASSHSGHVFFLGFIYWRCLFGLLSRFEKKTFSHER